MPGKDTEHVNPCRAMMGSWKPVVYNKKFIKHEVLNTDFSREYWTLSILVVVNCSGVPKLRRDIWKKTKITFSGISTYNSGIVWNFEKCREHF